MVIKLCSAAMLLIAGMAGQPMEKGKFVLHKFARAIGEETYEDLRRGNVIERRRHASDL